MNHTVKNRGKYRFKRGKYAGDTCIERGCIKPARVNGYCMSHNIKYWRLKKADDNGR